MYQHLQWPPTKHDAHTDEFSAPSKEQALFDTLGLPSLTHFGESPAIIQNRVFYKKAPVFWVFTKNPPWLTVKERKSKLYHLPSLAFFSFFFLPFYLPFIVKKKIHPFRINQWSQTVGSPISQLRTQIASVLYNKESFYSVAYYTTNQQSTSHFFVLISYPVACLRLHPPSLFSSLSLQQRYPDTIILSPTLHPIPAKQVHCMPCLHKHRTQKQNPSSSSSSQPKSCSSS